MGKDMEIKVITYEESRLEFFKIKRDIEFANYERFKKSSALKELPPMEQHRMLSEIGERISYWNDIVKMLEDNVKNNHKKATTVANPDTPTKTDFKYFTAEQVRNMSQKEVKENFTDIRKSMEKW